LRIRSPVPGMTEQRRVRAVLAGLHWPLGVPKEATHSSSDRSVFSSLETMPLRRRASLENVDRRKFTLD